MRSHLHHLLLPWGSLSCLLGMVDSAHGQLGAADRLGTLIGQAVAESDASPVAFALIRLLPEDALLAAPGSVVTDSAGLFLFTDLPPGRYRLQLQRIGFEAAWSDTVRIESGRSTAYVLHARLQPVTLEGITMRGNACYPVNRLDQVPDLASLWDEVKKGVETHRAFLHHHRYTFDRTEEAALRILGGERKGRSDTTLTVSVILDVGITDSEAERKRRTSQLVNALLDGESGEGELPAPIPMPDQAAILKSDFAREFCLEQEAESSDDGAIALRFVRSKGGSKSTWTVRLQGDDYQLQSIHAEAFERGRKATMVWHYSDVAVPGGSIRLPTEGEVLVEIGGFRRLLLKGIHMRFSNRNFRDWTPVAAVADSI